MKTTMSCPHSPGRMQSVEYHAQVHRRSRQRARSRRRYSNLEQHLMTLWTATMSLYHLLLQKLDPSPGSGNKN
jgi:hypothetical protein